MNSHYYIVFFSIIASWTILSSESSSQGSEAFSNHSSSESLYNPDSDQSFHEDTEEYLRSSELDKEKSKAKKQPLSKTIASPNRKKKRKQIFSQNSKNFSHINTLNDTSNLFFHSSFNLDDINTLHEKSNSFDNQFNQIFQSSYNLDDNQSNEIFPFDNQSNQTFSLTIITALKKMNSQEHSAEEILRLNNDFLQQFKEQNPHLKNVNLFFKILHSHNPKLLYSEIHKKIEEIIDIIER